MAERNLPREKKFMTLRLLPEDRQLLQDLGRGREKVPDRYTALCELTDIVQKLEIRPVEKQERQPLRLGIPESLDEAIREVVEKTDQTYLHILLAAATEYRRRYPYCTDSEE